MLLPSKSLMICHYLLVALLLSFQAIFLGHLIGPELGTASAHNSLKSISGNSPGIKLATRHCFLLEDPPKDSKDPAVDRYIICKWSIFFSGIFYDSLTNK